MRETEELIKKSRKFLQAAEKAFEIGFVLEVDEVKQLLTDVHSFVQAVSEYLANWHQEQDGSESGV